MKISPKFYRNCIHKVQGSTVTIEQLGFLFLLLILIWGGLLRFSSLGSQSLWIDESFSALAAEKIAESGSPQLDSGRYYSRSKPHTYLRACIIKYFGKNAFTLRFPAALFGSAMILLAAFAGRIFYGRWLPGIIAALLISFNYLEIAWSRQIRMYMEYQFFFSLTLLLLYVFITKGNSSIYFMTSMLFCYVITLLLHQSGILIMIPLSIMAFAFRKNISRGHAAALLLFVLAAIAVFFTQYQWEWNNVLYGSGTDSAYVTRTLAQLGHYWIFLLHNHSFTIFVVFLSLLFFPQSRVGINIVLLFSFLATLLLISSRNGVIMRNLFFISPLLIYAAGHGLTLAGESAAALARKTGFVKKQTPAAAALIAVLLAAAGISTAAYFKDQYVAVPRTAYFLEYDPTYSDVNTWDFTPQPDFNAAYGYVKDHLAPDDIFIVAHTALHHWYMPHSRSYWLGFLFLDDPKRTNFVHVQANGEETEGYMGYPVIRSREDLERIFNRHHGFVLIDYYSMATQTPPEYVKYLLERAPVVFHSDAHPDRPWTRIWVGRF